MNDPDDPAKLFAQGAWSRGGDWEVPEPESLRIPGVHNLSYAGRGGMGAVYSGVQTSLDRPVAVKVLPGVGDILTKERFIREARILASLEHPSILRIIEFGETDSGMLFLVMEWAGGGDLQNRLQRSAPSVSEILDWISQISGGLDFAHRAGVIHRDLKPGNLLLDRHGRIKIGDFGLAQAAGPGFTTTLTLSGTRMGTLDYMAPEQFASEGQITRQTDIFALGVLTYQLLTGKLPKGAFPSASSIAPIPKAVDAVLAKALASDPAHRYESAGEFHRALGKALHRKSRAAAITLVTAGGLAAATFVAIQSSHERRAPVARAVSTPLPLSTPPSSPIGTPVSLPTVLPTPLPVASAQPTAVPTPVASPSAIAQKKEWVSLIPRVQPQRDVRSGEWQQTVQGITTNAERCVLALPVQATTNYDMRIRFTRLSGQHSVAVFLPTASGPATLELDAWERHLGGLQDIDGRDMRASSETFAAQLPNGVPQELLVEVRSDEVRCEWNGRTMKWPIAGRSLSINPLWRTDVPALPGVGSWESPALFQSIEFREANPQARH